LNYGEHGISFSLSLLQYHIQIQLADPFWGRQEGVKVEPVTITGVGVHAGLSVPEAAEGIPVLLEVEDEG
jgi:hypothetical protein